MLLFCSSFIGFRQLGDLRRSRAHYFCAIQSPPPGRHYVWYSKWVTLFQSGPHGTYSVKHFVKAHASPNAEEQALHDLDHIQQGISTVAEYTLQFRRIARMEQLRLRMISPLTGTASELDHQPSQSQIARSTRRSVCAVCSAKPKGLHPRKKYSNRNRNKIKKNPIPY